MTAMDQFFAHYIDLTMLGLALLIALLFTWRWGRKAAIRWWIIFSLFFVLFNASTNVMAFTGHLFENGYRAVTGSIAGSFHYTYHYYSLMLMGIVFFSISLYMLLQVNVKPVAKPRILRKAT